MAEKTPLRLACDMYAECVGSCPYDMHDLYESWEESCYEKCSAFIDYAECWERYFIQQAEKGHLMTSTKDPIERLREIAATLDDAAASMSEHGFSIPGIKAKSIANEIEAQYLKLPVDADGVPIHPGDEIQFGTNSPVHVYSIGTSRCDCGDFGWFGSDGGFYGMGTLRSCRHVKPDTVESVLMEAMQWAFTEPYNTGNLYAGDKVADYAERIRAAVDGNGHQDHLWVSAQEYNGLVDAAGECQKWRDECEKLGEQLDRLRNDEGVA